MGDERCIHCRYELCTQHHKCEICLESQLAEAVTLLARERDAFGQRETELMALNAAFQARLDIFINIAWRAKDLETDPATHKFITDTLASLSPAPSAKERCVEETHGCTALHGAKQWVPHPDCKDPNCIDNFKVGDSAKPADGGEAKS